MILHTVNKSPHRSTLLQDCLSVCKTPASVLLIEDGVYGAAVATEGIAKQGITFYALEADILARGLLDKIHQNVSIVDDAGFVELVTQHSAVQSWY